jgi:hypothetical protein
MKTKLRNKTKKNTKKPKKTKKTKHTKHTKHTKNTNHKKKYQSYQKVSGGGGGYLDNLLCTDNDIITYIVNQCTNTKTIECVLKKLAEQIPTDITVFRGQQPEFVSPPSKFFPFFSTTKSYDVAKKDFASKDGNVFKIYVIGARVLDVNKVFENQIKDFSKEMEVIVEGGGTFIDLKFNNIDQNLSQRLEKLKKSTNQDTLNNQDTFKEYIYIPGEDTIKKNISQIIETFENDKKNNKNQGFRQIYNANKIQRYI